jgi:cation transport ATPase
MEHEEKKEHHEHEKPEEHEKHEKAPEKHEKAPEKHEQEKPAPNEKKELRDSRVSMIVFTLAGVAMALASSVLKSSGLSNYITATLGLVALVVVMGIMQKMFKRKVKFFLSGAFAYVFVWLVFWIFLFNM